VNKQQRKRKRKQIIEQAAAASRQAVANEAQVKADRAAAEKKVGEDAAKKAREGAKGKAAEAKKAADEKQEEAEKELKEAETAAEDAKAEAEKATAKVAPEKQAPIMFHDAYQRSYKLPFELCAKGRISRENQVIRLILISAQQMETMIVQAHQGFGAAELLMQRRYDLLGPSGEVIMPRAWLGYQAKAVARAST
jgi:hypothetical protein